MELQYVCQKLRNKIPCCAVIKDTSCKMATLLEGQVAITKILVDEFDSRNKNCDNDIMKLIAARCFDFLSTQCDNVSHP
jgi:hypothetical protein